MDLFTYDHEELARRIPTGLDRIAANYLRAHGAKVHRDDADFHGFEHLDLEVTFDNHHLVVRQTDQLRAVPGEPPKTDHDLNHFESTWIRHPAVRPSTALIAQWLALLPDRGVQRAARETTG